MRNVLQFNVRKSIRQAVLYTAVLFTLYLSPGAVLAIDLPRADEQARTAAGRAGLSGTEGNSLFDLIGILISATLAVLGIIFLILIVYAGFLWITAAGKEDQLNKAKRILSGAVIGLAIVFAAYAISTFVLGSITDATG